MINTTQKPRWERKYMVLLFLFVGLFNYDIGGISILYWGITLGCSLLLILENNGRLIFRINQFWTMYIFFTLFCILSLVWAIDTESAIDYLKSVIINFLVLFAISSMIDDVESLKKILVVMMWSIFLTAVYLILKVDWASVGIDRLGTDYTGKGWNANALGLMMIWGIAIAIQILEKKRMLKILIMAPMLIILGFSGSRKAWLAFALVIATIMFLRNKKKLLRNILIFVIVLIGCGYLIMNVPFLYDLGGYRFEQLVLGLLGKGEIDHSSYLRQEYAKLGIEWFKSRPILGYGINCYRKLLLGSVFHENTYAHNNYVELLCDTGIVGTAIFYSIYLWEIVKGIKDFFNEWRNPTESGNFIFFLLCLTVIQLIMQIGMVSYTDLPSLIIVMVFCYAINFQNYERNLV